MRYKSLVAKLSAVWLGALLPQAAFAWYEHGAFMPWVVDAMVKEFSIVPRHPIPKLMREKLPKRNSDDERYKFDFLAQILLIQPDAQPKSMVAETYRELLSLAVDDPDHGLDKDLPDSADPNNDRTYMGGTSGHGSQGFRHQYFGGWKLSKPLATFQVPPRAMGQAPDRIELLANEAKKKFHEGDIVWGMRLLGWALHYVQDLTQPFHTVQVPTLRMVPWSSMFTWPPQNGFRNLVKESTRVITNYHWAYEGYVRTNLLKKDESPFKECLEEPSATLLLSSPRELAMEVIRQSVGRGPETGNAIMAFAGDRLKEPGVSIPLKTGDFDEHRLYTDPGRDAERKRIHEVTCQSLKLAKSASIWLVRWTFNP